ncbi:L,D-transpeptidase family protein [Streptomyces himalayensis]|uniref:Murein L,D-transpeptidase n=1 Tax=Streptomyces himalayensis subsp. himalayensis TaxID=2756131 RepID=A0A7W0DQL2_9ACTN|nr:L,D-transpeptidase family protein [Streptomyces himalayensis]MBA2948958.1 murein L,D-transpeptidase [Streptomyces himalayensis subsp. himalayensis]
MRASVTHTPVVRASLAAAAALALMGVTTGCAAQAAGSDEKVPPVRIPPTSAAPDKPSEGAGDSKPSASATPSRTPKKPKVLMAQGATSGKVRELQARLRALKHFDRAPTGYYGTITVAAVSAFQGAHDLPRTGKTDTATWRKLRSLTGSPTRDELYPPTTLPVAKPDPRCMTGRVLCISKKSRTLSWMVDGKVLSSMDVRFGSQYTPTREGTFSVYWKSRHHVSTIYDTPMPYAMFFSGGQAVHYSADFAAQGYSGASHGCVNVRDEGKIANLFAQVRNGDQVVIYW